MSRRLSVLLFVLLALPVSCFMAWAMPPYFNVDETNHVMRSETVLHGHFFGRKDENGNSGGNIDSGLLALLSHYWPVLSDPSQHVTPDLVKSGRAIQWEGNRHFVHIPNTAIYPPNLYVPTIIGLGLGKISGMSVQDSILTARFFNIGFSITILAAALWLTAYGRGPMMAVALWPMSIAQYAASSQDGLLIALSALYVALLSRPMVERRRAMVAEFIGLAIIVALISMARPTNLLLLMPLWWVMPARIGRWPAWTAPLLVAVITVGWCLHAILFVQVMQVHGDVVPDMKAQIRHILAHPTAFPVALYNTLDQWGWPFTVAMLGWVGWANTNIVLPEGAYHFYLITLALAFGLGAADPGNHTSLKSRLIAGLALGGSFLAIFFLQYLTFTAPGADSVGGVQGRYFVPLAMMLTLLLPAIAPRLPVTVICWLQPLTVTLIMAIGITTAMVLPHETMLEIYFNK